MAVTEHYEMVSDEEMLDLYKKVWAKQWTTKEVVALVAYVIEKIREEN